MLRAVPSIMRRAVSTSEAFRSAIFRSAISSIWARVTVPTFSLRGHARPLGDAGRLLQQVHGRRALGHQLERAVVVDPHDDRDPHARWSLVRSLNCWTNCPRLIPNRPSAVPTGGAGVAWPPGT